jgi:hypothetical protein
MIPRDNRPGSPLDSPQGWAATGPCQPVACRLQLTVATEVEWQ